jgi:hypothetical protein
MTEEWRAVPGYEGHYEVSDQGRVRSLRLRGRGKHGWYDRPRSEPFVMHPDTTPDGYRVVELRGQNLKPRRWRINRLVLMAFVGPCPAGHQSAHENGRRDDNRRENLSWKTMSANNQDKWRHGTMPTGDASGSRLHPESRPRGDRNGSRLHTERLKRGDDHPARLHPECVRRGEACHTAKLTPDLVRDIRRRYAAGEGSQRVLAAEYGLALSSLRQVVVRLSWRHVE